MAREGAPRTFTRVIELDTLFNRGLKDSATGHWVGSTFTAWKVIATNDENFKLSLAVDPRGNKSDSYPVNPTGWENLPENRPATDGVFENTVAQPGVWVEVQFLTEGMFFSGRQSSGATQSTVLSGGGSFTGNDKYEVTNVAAQLLPVDSNRASSHIYTQSAEAIYVGTQAKISDADFVNTCVKIKPGNEIPFIWDLAQALWARKEEAVGSVWPVVLHKGKV